jgi:hypothetical protein
VGREYAILISAGSEVLWFFFFPQHFSPHLGILSALIYSPPVLRWALLTGSAFIVAWALVAALPLLAALLLWSPPWPAVAASVLGHRLSRSSPHHPSSPSLIFAYKVNISIRNIQTHICRLGNRFWVYAIDCALNL